MTISKFKKYGRQLKNGVRLVFGVHDMPTQCPLQLDEVS